MLINDGLIVVLMAGDYIVYIITLKIQQKSLQNGDLL